MRRAWGAAQSTFAAVSATGAVLVYVARSQPSSTAFAQPQERVAFEKCPEVACKGSEDLASLFDGPVTRRARPLNASTASGGQSEAGKNGSAQGGFTIVPPTRDDCPLNREQLGRATWAFLHSTAAYYPDHPTEDDIAAATGLVQSIAQLYPCKHCRAAFAMDIQEHPPKLGSREEFSLWLCRAHNRVSESLGRPKGGLFPCTLPALDERWRTGRPSCWAAVEPSRQEEQTAEESLGQAKEDDE